MADEPRYSSLAARVLRAKPPSPDSRVTRDVGISLVAHGISLARRRRQLRVAIWGALGAAAAALALVLAWPRSPERVAIAARACVGPGCAGATTLRAPTERGTLTAGESLAAPLGAAATALLASGTRLDLAAGGRIECREDGPTQHLALSQGMVHLKVQKLHTGERFVVSTPQAEVEVRGTVFDVSIEAATASCAERTSVAVEEGRVEVRAAGGGTVLQGGGRWTSPCVQPVAVVEQHPTAPRVEHPSAGSFAARSGTTPVAPSAPATDPAPEEASVASPSAALVSSALREQNDLFAQAEAAQREGRVGEALSLYTRLVNQYERGPLTESATVARVRILSHTDRARAQSEAERYLDHFPFGFARAEMSKLAGTP